MQKDQLSILQTISGAEFEFVSANKNPFGIKYYEHKCKDFTEYQDIAGQFNEVGNIVYRCLNYPDKTFSIIVLENEMDAFRYDSVDYNRISDIKELQPIGKINGNDVFLEPILTSKKTCSTIVSGWNRAIVVVNINGHRLPFYVSSGAAGKDKGFGIPSGKWYPLQGLSGRWLNKMPDMMKNPYPELDQICELLEQKFPGTKMKQDASNGSLPVVDIQNLLQIANYNFPEGVSLTEYTNYAYVKNYCVYLPEIINAWRSKPTDFLNISDGFLSLTDQKILKKVQKLQLFCSVTLQDDYIWFKPIEDNTYEYVTYSGFDTEDGIYQALLNLGIALPYITKNGTQGFGISVQDFVNYFTRRKQQAFEKASEKLTKNNVPASKKPNSFQSIINKVSEFFKD
ncbi:MAG: hypothetical protein MJ165_01170 [Alphaproteobacteria bacterium]|nr:hypothetical protein [Alphaproteobacteria bacterium]